MPRTPESILKAAREWKKRNRSHINAYKRAYHHRNKQKVNASRRALWQKDEMRQMKSAIQSKGWREKNRDAMKQLLHQWYENNKAYHRECGKKWVEEHKDQARLYYRRHSSNRRAAARNSHSSYTLQDILNLKKAQRGKCYWCRNNYGPSFEIDHVWPLSKGGSNGPENIVIACKPCNRKKRNLTPSEWAGVLL